MSKFALQLLRRLAITILTSDPTLAIALLTHSQRSGLVPIVDVFFSLQV